MDFKLIVAKSITLLFKESLIKNSNTNSADLIKQIITTIKIPDISMDHDKSRDIIVNLRSTLLWMADNPIGYQYDKSSLHQRIRIHAGDDPSTYHAITDALNEEITDQDALKKSILDYKDFLKEYVQREKIREVLTANARLANFSSETVDWKTFAREIMDKLEPLTGTGDSRAHSSVVVDVDLRDTAAVANILSMAKDELSPVGALRTGIQAWNRMLGSAGGYRRGEMVVVPALQHNFKSGMMLTLMRQIAMYNVPHMRDPTKKPMLMRISYENEAQTDIMWLYKSLKEIETGEYCVLTDVDTSEAAQYVLDRMEATGYHINFVRIDPSDYTFYDLFDRIMYFESQGYEIHAVFCDYLNMMSKRGCNQGAMGSEIRDLFRRCRNFFSPRGITFFTPHQLSTEAKQLVRNGVDNFVQEIANKGYYDSCKTIDQEVDIETYIHIEKRGLDSYLAVQRGKHRKVSITPQKDLYFVLKFHPIGGILDDINGRDMSMKHIGGATMSEGGAPGWFDTKAA
jgi:hypothetical protein